MGADHQANGGGQLFHGRNFDRECLGWVVRIGPFDIQSHITYKGSGTFPEQKTLFMCPSCALYKSLRYGKAKESP
jgi:hypothetical protein